MADLKISQLTSATTPLAGTEVLPIVQSSSTKKVSIENVLTSVQPSGTAYGVAYLNGSKVLTSGSALQFDGTNFVVGATSLTNAITTGGVAVRNDGGARGQIFIGKSVSGTFDAQLFYHSNAYVGGIQISDTTTALITSSDYRLKKDIAPMTGALAKVASLNPVTYKWKVNGSNGQGFIAHELQTVFPDAVRGQKDGVEADGSPRYQGIDTSFLVATLTAAIQEQQSIIQSLQARLDAANI
jgi:hypothetical protein